MSAQIECPNCKKPVTWNDNPDRPFCSEKCRLIDLGNWSDEAYRVPGQSLSEENLENVIDINSYKNKGMEV